MAGFKAATRAEEGNISFDWARSADVPSCWIVVEAFRDSDAGASHVQSEHVQAATHMLSCPRGADRLCPAQDNAHRR